MPEPFERNAALPNLSSQALQEGFPVNRYIVDLKAANEQEVRAAALKGSRLAEAMVGGRHYVWVRSPMKPGRAGFWEIPLTERKDAQVVLDESTGTFVYPLWGGEILRFRRGTGQRLAARCAAAFLEMRAKAAGSPSAAT